MPIGKRYESLNEISLQTLPTSTILQLIGNVVYADSLYKPSQRLLQDAQIIRVVVHKLVVLDGAAFVRYIWLVLQHNVAPTKARGK